MSSFRTVGSSSRKRADHERLARGLKEKREKMFQQAGEMPTDTLPTCGTSPAAARILALFSATGVTMTSTEKASTNRRSSPRKDHRPSPTKERLSSPARERRAAPAKTEPRRTTPNKDRRPSPTKERRPSPSKLRRSQSEQPRIARKRSARASAEKTKFSKLFEEVKQFQKLVAELDGLVGSGKELTPETQWRTRILLTSGDQSDRAILKQIDSEKKQFMSDPAVRSSFTKLRRDFERAHGSYRSMSKAYKKKQAADIAMLTGVDQAVKDEQEEKQLEKEKEQEQEKKPAKPEKEDFFERTMKERELAAEDLKKINEAMTKVNLIYKDLSHIVGKQQGTLPGVEDSMRLARAHIELGAENFGKRSYKKKLGTCGGIQDIDDSVLDQVGQVIPNCGLVDDSESDSDYETETDFYDTATNYDTATHCDTATYADGSAPGLKSSSISISEDDHDVRDDLNFGKRVPRRVRSYSPKLSVTSWDTQTTRGMESRVLTPFGRDAPSPGAETDLEFGLLHPRKSTFGTTDVATTERIDWNTPFLTMKDDMKSVRNDLVSLGKELIELLPRSPSREGKSKQRGRSSRRRSRR